MASAATLADQLRRLSHKPGLWPDDAELLREAAAALAAAEAPTPGEASFADVARLTEQALAISQILASAGIGGGTSLVEGVRQLWVQRDDALADNVRLVATRAADADEAFAERDRAVEAAKAAVKAANDAEGRANALAESWHTKAVHAEAALEEERRKWRIAVKMATQAHDELTAAYTLLKRVRQMAKDASDKATDQFDNHKSDWHEGMNDLACCILDAIDGTEERR